MIRVYRNIEPQEQLVAGYDLATGQKDFCAVQWISLTRNDVPLVLHTEETASRVTNELVLILEKLFDMTQKPVLVAPETNNGGVFEIDRMIAMNRRNAYTLYQQPSDLGKIADSAPIRYGWTTTSSSRPKMLADLKNAIDNRLLTIYDRKTVEELYSFVVVQRGSGAWRAQAETGAHDDLVMALAIAYQTHEAQTYQTEVFRENVSRYGEDFQFVNQESQPHLWRIGR
jgi:hypothetical protein